MLAIACYKDEKIIFLHLFPTKERAKSFKNNLDEFGFYDKTELITSAKEISDLMKKGISTFIA